MKNEKDSLAIRMKSYEAQYEQRISYDEFLICRIDGHKFSKFTKGFDKPFDKILSETMIKTTESLIKKFGAVTGYTQSDEISLVFPPMYKEKLVPIEWKEIEVNYNNIPEYRVFDRKDEFLGHLKIVYELVDETYNITDFYITNENGQTLDQCTLQNNNPQTKVKTEEMFKKYLIKRVDITNEQIFGGRVQKMTSLISAFTTMTFNKHLIKEINLQTKVLQEYFNNSFSLDEDEIEFNKKMETYTSKAGNAWFDARVFSVPTKEEAFNTILHRVRDCEKNSRSVFAYTYCGHKKLLNKTGQEQVQFCKEQTGHDWELIEDYLKYGTFIKKEQYLKPISSGAMDYNQNEFVERTRLIRFAKKLTTFSDDNVDLIVRKYK